MRYEERGIKHVGQISCRVFVVRCREVWTVKAGMGRGMDGGKEEESTARVGQMRAQRAQRLVFKTKHYTQIQINTIQ